MLSYSFNYRMLKTFRFWSLTCSASDAILFPSIHSVHPTPIHQSATFYQNLIQLFRKMNKKDYNMRYRSAPFEYSKTKSNMRNMF